MDEMMVERVAKAMTDAESAYWAARMRNGDMDDTDDHPVVELLARAAIEAMREPTEHMLNIGSCYEDPSEHYRAEIELGIRNEGDIARDVYRMMIDAALRETALQEPTAIRSGVEDGRG